MRNLIHRGTPAMRKASAEKPEEGQCGGQRRDE
jgi:hypothetical protein